MKIAIPDLISNSYFPVVAAVELGFFKEEGLNMDLELIFPFNKTLEELRDGNIDFAGGSSHSVPSAFPGWKGAKLLANQAQNMYWFLIMHKDLGIKRGDIQAVRGKNIGAAPLVNLGLRRLLTESGIDPEKDVNIGPVPGAFLGENKNFGVAAAKALEAKLIDGFWANGMGAEVAVTGGWGTLVIDARRGDGPPGAVNFTSSCMIGTDKMIKDRPNDVAAAIRALVKTQKALKADVSLATKAAKKWFPELETGLIAQVVQRDLPLMTPNISPEFVKGMVKFQHDMGLLKDGENPTYEDVVATQFANLWNA